MHGWSKLLGTELEAECLPSFDGRAVMLPSEKGVRDYFAWRQVDCHINNLYNTTFWALVQQGGMKAADAEQELAVCLFPAEYRLVRGADVVERVRVPLRRIRMRSCSRGSVSITIMRLRCSRRERYYFGM